MLIKEYPAEKRVEIIVPKCPVIGCGKQMIYQSGLLMMDYIFSCREDHVRDIPDMAQVRMINKYPRYSLTFVDERGNKLEM